MTNFLEQAKRRWPNAPIIGSSVSGRFAVAEIGENGRTKRVYLVDTREQQAAVALGCDHSLKIDLGLDADELLAKIPDLYDPEERRRERREKRG